MSTLDDISSLAASLPSLSNNDQQQQPKYRYFQFHDLSSTIHLRWNDDTGQLEMFNTEEDGWIPAIVVPDSHKETISPSNELTNLFGEHAKVSFSSDDVQDTVGRVWHESAVIDNKVYVFGGQLRNNTLFTDTLRTIEEQDDGTFLITPVPIVHNDSNANVALPILAGHRMVAIGRKLYVFGGVERHNTNYSNSLFVFNTETCEWSQPVITGCIPLQREGHTMTHKQLEHSSKPSNRIYIFGGYADDTQGIEGFQNDMHILEVETMTFRKVEAIDGSFIPSPRFYHSAILFENIIYVFGGYESEGRIPLECMYRFDTNSEQWLEPIDVPDFVYPHGLSEHTATIVRDYMIIFGGRQDSEIYETTDKLTSYNFTTGVWETHVLVSKYPFIRGGHTMTRLSNGRLLLIGGCSYLNEDNDLVLIYTNLPDEHSERDKAHFSTKLHQSVQQSILGDIEFQFE